MSEHGHDLAHHRKTYRWVWAFLLVLTIITVWVAYFNFGVLNILVAMAIATLKAALVCLYFMHLKYDNKLNQVVFVSAFVFLAIFAGLTLSDELFRPVEAKVKVAAIEAPAGSQTALHESLRRETPVLVSKGKEIYALQCATCHGATGQGNGPAAAALKPSPRDFTSGEWKFGGAPSQIFKTVSEGSPGTGMASFSSLSIEDRWALVHFVRTFSSQPVVETDESMKASGLFEAAATSTPSTPKLPIELAIDIMTEEASSKQ